jgi:hypothetical protein
MTRFALAMWWRSGTATLVPIVVALEVPSLLECRDYVGVNWMSAFEVANGSAVILFIAAVLSGAALAVRWSARVPALAGAPDGARLAVMLVPALVVATTIGVTHVLWTGFVLVLAGPGTPGAFQPVVVVPPLLGVVAFSLIGYVVGSVVRNWLAPPLLALGLYAFLVSDQVGRLDILFDLGWIAVRLPEAQVRTSVSWAQAALYAAIAISAVLGVRALWERGRVAAGIVLCSIPALVLGTLPALTVGTERFEFADLIWGCTTTAPRFCAISEDQARLHARLPRLLAAAQRWESLGVGRSPDTYWEWLQWPVVGHDQVFSLRDDSGEQSAVEVIVNANSPCQDDWTDEQWDAEDVAIAGLIGTGLDESDTWDPIATRAAAKVLAC